MNQNDRNCLKFIPKVTKNIFIYVIIFILLILLYNLLLYIASSFPSSMIKKNVQESAEIFLQEGNNFYIYEGVATSAIDNYTNALQVNEAYSIDNQDRVYSYMSARKNYNPNITERVLNDTNGDLLSFSENQIDENGKPIPDDEYKIVEELSEFTKGNVTTSVTYSRYWHGYLAFLRPLLLLFNIFEIRMIIVVFMLALYVYLIYLLKKKIGKNTACIFAYVLLIMGYFTQIYSIQVAPVLIVTMISSILLLIRIEKYDFHQFNLHIFITASIANFVDYLTVPILSAGIPILIFYLYQRKSMDLEKEHLRYIKQIIIQSLVWMAGYGLTWMSKWILYGVLYHSNGILSAFTQIMYRTYGEKDGFDEYIYLFFQFLFLYLSAAIFLYLFGILFFQEQTNQKMKLRKKRKSKKSFQHIIHEEFPLLIIGCMPIAWTVILFNHTMLHGMFTYMGYVILLLVFLLIIQDMISEHAE